MVLSKSSEVKIYLENKETGEGSLLETLDHKIIKPLIDTFTSRYSGKVMYIDFWAPWCIPCMEAMPASKDIQKQFGGREIVFLFLASKCSDESWKATIANHHLTGVHIKLSDDQFNLLSSIFIITGIPHCVLIDRKGMVVDKNAVGPDHKIELFNQLDKLLR